MATVKKTKRSPTKKVATARKPPASRKATVPDTSATPARALPNSWQHLKSTLRLLAAHRKFFAAFVLLYALLNIIFVHSFPNNVTELKHELSSLVGGNVVLTGLSTYALLVTNPTASAGATAAYQYVVLILCSLACIWALRKTLQKDSAGTIRVRDSFYEGMAPLVPFLLVLAVLSLELVPLAAGASLVSIVLTNGIAVSVLERTAWIAVFLCFVAVTLWLLAMTLFAAYIVTLPGEKPIQALKDSVRITKSKRLVIIRRLLFLTLVLVVVSAAVLVPVILVAAPLTSVFAFVLGALALPFVHAYLFGLYRELLV